MAWASTWRCSARIAWLRWSEFSEVHQPSFSWEKAGDEGVRQDLGPGEGDADQLFVGIDCDGVVVVQAKART